MFPLKDDNPTETKPIITIALIILCVFIFIYQFSLIEKENFDLVHKFGMKPKKLFLFESVAIYFTLFSSMFLHGGFMHLIDGEFEKGWELYEYRASIKKNTSIRNIKLWKGEDLKDSKMLIKKAIF